MYTDSWRSICSAHASAIDGKQPMPAFKYTSEHRVHVLNCMHEVNGNHQGLNLG